MKLTHIALPSNTHPSPKRSLAIGWLGLLGSVWVMGGCVNSTEAAGPCEQASAHLASCIGGEVSTDETCDPAGAEMILQESCEGLEAKLGDQKSDLFSDFFASIGCTLGFYHLCETPMCDPAANEVAHVLSEEIPEGASACAQAALAYEGCGACEYYRCREEGAQCGEDGYLLNFAYRYCNRYRLVSEPEASPEGQAWLNRIRRCLITSLDEENQGNDCASIEETGLATHPTCYVETGFCDLPITDWILVLNTIDPGDLSFREMFVTGNACLDEWLGTN